MKIAITAYVDNMTKYVDECNLMTWSGRGLNERFTFVLYAHPDVVNLLDRWPNVIIHPYTVPEDKFYSEYKFARSMVFPYDKPEHLDGYDFICKTDTDVIFTESFNNFPFDPNKVYVGMGRYTVGEPVREELRKAAIRFGYPDYVRINDMHSTVVSTKEDMLNIMELSDKLERRMYYELEEPGEWNSDKLWRGYYGHNCGIVSMYAAEIVLSSVYKDKVVVTDKLDGGSDWPDNWRNFYQFHCYHHDNIYSKFQARYGAYLNAELATGESAAEYCLNVYVSKQKAMKETPDKFVNLQINIDPLPENPIWGYDAAVFKYAWEKTKACPEE